MPAKPRHRHGSPEADAPRHSCALPKGEPLSPLQRELIQLLARAAAREFLDTADPAETPPPKVRDA